MSIYLGVDGGGTKTAFLVINDRGETLAEHTGASSYYFDTGIGQVERVLAEGVAAVLADAALAPSDIDRSFFGIPGYGEASGDVDLLDGLPRRILGHDRYRCDNDMVCGWAGSLAGHDGINVISGTGSMTYGQNAGKRARVGGWGELFGDEGSAYWIAIQGLNAFTRMSDGRLPTGPLHDILSRRLQLHSDLDLVSLLTNGKQTGRTGVAALARSVSEAAGQGDAASADILLRAARELATLVEATRADLGYRDDEVVPVSFSGGVFSNPVVRDAFAGILDSDAVPYDLRQPLLTPVAGAALYAALEAGRALDNEAIAQLTTSSSARNQQNARVD